ncbi:hypothetical protein WR25_03350 [Diploscapter pachys]|uniref:PDZ domain-containing protein n=1 Tax=Diploscapter pachys TaxID=2018661 RepID=A0A2A2L3S9_9BILA|nr:hypothetical protein WR25_03350 [Diploscapter pachys]
MPSFFCLPLACNRQIDSLDRRQNNLQQVPHDIERYRSLEELLLAMNHIKELPKPLFRLPRLRLLDLSDNDIYCVPPEIANLANLVELNLSRNDISDLPEQLKECKQLMVLDLSSNPITRLPDTIAQCTQLTQLSLNDVSLTQLPADIGSLANLRSLEVRENLIRQLPPSISRLAKLQVLDLGQNEIDHLPADMGTLESLRELYVDANDLETLPDQITHCRLLEQLDVSENKLASLPHEFGDLVNLTDVNVSQNCLQALPSSMGRLKKLAILKVDRNAITALTSSIGNCESLTECFLTDNLLAEIPSSIGNLKQLKNLNLDKNQLSTIPASIGNCISLSVLSLRENKIAELPMDVGKCENLTVLDLCSNKLSYLPFTINVLYKLQALWLSENQSQAMLKLQQDRDPRTGVKVLTCYLLPQQSVQSTGPEKGQSRSFLGGPKVHFPDQESTVDEEKMPIGQFERHDTPHPKPQAGSIDGHVIHHDGQQPDSIALHKKSSTSSVTSPANALPQPAPRSAMKYQNVPPTQYDPEPSQRQPSSSNPVPNPTQSRTHATTNDMERVVAFVDDTIETSQSGTKLKRINTPHYKGVRGALPTDKYLQKDVRTSSRTIAGVEAQVKTIVIRRDQKGELGLSIAGGKESTPYKEGDNGLFVSKLVPGGPAQNAGLKLGDKLIRVDDTSVSNSTHDQAVTAMKRASERVELTVLRLEDSNQTNASSHDISGAFKASPEHTADLSFVSDAGDLSSGVSREKVSVTLRRDPSGSPGFTVAGGVGSGRDGIYVSHITPGGSADRQKLMVGDKVISINGTTMKGVRHDQAVALLTGHPQEDVYLVVQRDRPSLSSPLPSTPVIPSTVNGTSSKSPPSQNLPYTSASSASGASSTSNLKRTTSASVPLNQLGDTTSWDGKTETVDLHKEGRALGLSIVGGIDHSSHPFGVNSPGVFISKIASQSPADKCGRLRIGDRILRVNGRDVSKAPHLTAVEALKSSGTKVTLMVTHDPQPSGLREVFLRREIPHGQLGMSIHGGVGCKENPEDDTDEGIFIQKVDLNTVAEHAGLIQGQRIIEVNGLSLLGCTRNEAADILKRDNDLRLLVCDGYNRKQRTPSSSNVQPMNGSHHSTSSTTHDATPSSSRSTPRVLSPTTPTTSNPPQPVSTSTPNRPTTYSYGSATKEYGTNGNSGNQNGASPIVNLPIHSIINGASERNTIQESTSKIPVRETHIGNFSLNSSLSSEAPVAASSPLPPSSLREKPTPPATAPKPSKIPPPVAPKPQVRAVPPQDQNVPPPQTLDSDNPEKLTFQSKLQKFKVQINDDKVPSPVVVGGGSRAPPEKKRLLSEEDMKKMKEEEAKKMNNSFHQQQQQLSPEKSDEFFEHLLDDSPFPRQPSIIRTKKAENRAIAAGLIQPMDDALNEVERKALEQQRRSEWRAARLKSIDQERNESDAIIERLNLSSALSSIAEDGSTQSRVSPNQKILANEVTEETIEDVDPNTGEKTVTVVQKSLTKKEITFPASTGINFADD